MIFDDSGNFGKSAQVRNKNLFHLISAKNNSDKKKKYLKINTYDIFQPIPISILKTKNVSIASGIYLKRKCARQIFVASANYQINLQHVLSNGHKIIISNKICTPMH